MTTTMGGKVYAGYVSGVLTWLSLDAFIDVFAFQTVTAGGATESIEKMTLVGALVVAVVVLWRSYSAAIAQQNKLTEHIAAQTEVIRQCTHMMEAINEGRAETVTMLHDIQRDVSELRKRP